MDSAQLVADGVFVDAYLGAGDETLFYQYPVEAGDLGGNLEALARSYVYDGDLLLDPGVCRGSVGGAAPGASRHRDRRPGIPGGLSLGAFDEAGYAPIRPLLEDGTVSEIMINGLGAVLRRARRPAGVLRLSDHLGPGAQLPR